MKTIPPKGVLDGLVSLVRFEGVPKATSKTSTYDVIVYKVPSKKLNNYTIRIDIKIGEDE